MTLTKKLSIFLVVLLAYSICIAQKPLIKFGDVPLDQLKMTVYEQDSNASAVVLADYGSSQIDYQTDQFKVIFSRHIRIKILNKDGYDWGNGEARVYHSGSSEEKFGALKGVTYNLENGKVVKTKLEKQSIFREKINDHWDAVKFSMPNVKEGSIIEYSYKITSDFLFNYREWYFQKSIPVAWSEYRASFIEYYNYEKVFQGYIPFKVSDVARGRQSFTIKTTSKVDPSTGKYISGSTNNYDATNEKFRWVAENVPAFVSEPYMTTRENYISKVSFELESSKFPNSPIKYYRGSWEKLNNQFLEYESFGSKVKGSGFLTKHVHDIISDEDSDQVKVSKIYNYIKKNVKWDGNSRKYLDSGFKKTLDNKTGSSAEINLLLTTMLKKAGINADPVLISTRSNGFIRENHPVSDQFNYVICKVDFEQGYLLLDATEAYLPMGVLPERCLNGRGYTISETNPGWVDLVSSFNKGTTISGEVIISDEGELAGSLNYKYGGYNGLAQRKSYFKKGEEDFVGDKKSNSGWDIDKIEIQNQADYTQPFEVKYNLEIDEGAESLGNIIYLNPMLSGKFEKNPFTLEKREYPIDFSCPIEQVYYVVYTLPEGFALEAPVKPFMVAIPEKSAAFRYNVLQNENKLTVLSKLNINKTLFVMDEYPYIKEFFAQIVAKQNEQIVLKKL